MDNSGNKSNDEIFSFNEALKFEFNSEKIEIKNENELLAYIQKIDTIAGNFENKYNFKYLNNENIEQKNEKKFIPIFSKKNQCYETINLNIKYTFSNDKDNNHHYNNVFVLNDPLEENQEFSFEIKLGQGYWGNMNNLKSDNNLMIGLLKLNKEKITEISDYITINNKRKFEYKKSNDVFNINPFSDEKNFQKNFEEYKKTIYNYVDINEFKVSIYKNNNDNKGRPIQNNDIIGIVFNNKTSKEFIEMKIYINGILINNKIIKKEVNLGQNVIEYDDDFNIEKQNKNINHSQVLVPFIEVGDNKMIFIKDKSTINKESRKKIEFIEKIEYIDVYDALPLNSLPDEIFELKQITDCYFDILDKIGFKIFKNNNNNIVKKYFNQLIHFFEHFSFVNRLVAESCLLNFLLKGIDINNGNITHFKENLETLLKIVNKIEIFNESRKINLLEKLILFLVEIIIENNTNYIDIYKINNSHHSELDNYRKNKFILCFLLLDNFFSQGLKYGIASALLSKVSLLKDKNNLYMFYFAIFNTCFYFNPVNDEEYLKQFYINNIFDRKKFLNDNFMKFIGNNFLNKILEDNEYIIKLLIKDINNKEKLKTKNLFKFLTTFCSTNDNISIINFIILQLIKYYFNISVDIDGAKVDKIIYYNYGSNNKYPLLEKEENTFFGKANAGDNIYFLNNLNEQDEKYSFIFELIIRCTSNYYEIFSSKEKNANDILESLSDKNKYNDLEIYKINNMIEFYRTMFFGNFFIYYGYFINYLLKFLLISIKKNYLNVIPYYCYLQNILFILDMLKIRCSFIDKNNIIDQNEISIIYSVIDKTLKYVSIFLCFFTPKLKNTNFNPIEKFEDIISLNIKILIKVLSFDKNLLKNSFSSVKDNLVSTFKNLVKLYDKEKYKIIYTNINELIEFIYGSNYKKSEQINIALRNMFFKKIIAAEIEEYNKKINENNSAKNNYIENTMYYNIFVLIYKRVKIIRKSLNEIFEDNFLFENNILYQEEYLVKFTNILKTFDNFLIDNNLNLIYDIGNSLFLKINSFICKTFKLLSKENTMTKFQNIFKDNDKIFKDFFTIFFFLISHLLIKKDHNGFEYYFQMSKNRKGFYFEKFKINFEKFFGYPEFKTMIDFLDILLKQFKQLCPDKDVLNIEDVNDNSIELEKRDNCPICLEFTDEEKDVHINPCNHLMHRKCFEELISKSRKNQCPLCKRNILGIKEDPSFKVGSDSSQRYLFNNIDIFQRDENPFLFGSESSSNFEGSQENSNLSQRNRVFGSPSDRLSSDNNYSNQNINNFSIGLFGNNSNHRNLFVNNSLFG